MTIKIQAFQSKGVKTKEASQGKTMPLKEL